MLQLARDFLECRKNNNTESVLKSLISNRKFEILADFSSWDQINPKTWKMFKLIVAQCPPGAVTNFIFAVNNLWPVH